MTLKRHHPGIPKLVLTILATMFLLCPARSQDRSTPEPFNITGHTLRFPENPKHWRFRTGVGLLFAIPPVDIVETSLQAPLVNAHMTFGLPWKFSLAADITTIVVSSQLAFGARIGSGFGNFAINAGWDFAWVYGQFRPEGFNNVTKAWFYYPNVSAGYKSKKMAFTLRAEAVIISSIEQLIGQTAATGTVLASYENSFNGITCALYLEQRLWKNNILVIGIKDSYIKYYWPTWMLFSTFNRFYHIPEISLMLIL